MLYDNTPIGRYDLSDDFDFGIYVVKISEWPPKYFNHPLLSVKKLLTKIFLNNILFLL